MLSIFWSLNHSLWSFLIFGLILISCGNHSILRILLNSKGDRNHLNRIILDPRDWSGVDHSTLIRILFNPREDRNHPNRIILNLKDWSSRDHSTIKILFNSK